MRCDYLSLSEIPASGTKVLIWNKMLIFTSRKYLIRLLPVVNVRLIVLAASGAATSAVLMPIHDTSNIMRYDDLSKTRATPSSDKKYTHSALQRLCIRLLLCCAFRGLLLLDFTCVVKCFVNGTWTGILKNKNPMPVPYFTKRVFCVLMYCVVSIILIITIVIVIVIAIVIVIIIVIIIILSLSSLSLSSSLHVIVIVIVIIIIIIIIIIITISIIIIIISIII